MENGNKAERLEAIKQFFKTNAVYVILILCLLITGVAAVAIFAGGDEGENVNRSGDERIQAVVSDTPYKPSVTTAPSASQASPSPSPNVSEAISTAPQTPAEQKPSLLNPPVSGKVVWGYASDELIYSQTLNQWMTHPAVDISAGQGEAVRAVADATVEDVFEDDALGYAVRLKHKNGHVSIYASLDKPCELKEGDMVKKGDVIGTVGNSAVSECKLNYHLHFEYIVDNKHVDPTKYVLFIG